jgi:hypothetical protein
MKKLRLVKITMQPTFVIDDGAELIEQIGAVFVVPAAAVPYFSEKWEHDFEEMRIQFESRQTELQEFSAQDGGNRS